VRRGQSGRTWEGGIGRRAEAGRRGDDGGNATLREASGAASSFERG
jgi:hypothetical protein